MFESEKSFHQISIKYKDGGWQSFTSRPGKRDLTYEAYRDSVKIVNREEDREYTFLGNIDQIDAKGTIP